MEGCTLTHPRSGTTPSSTHNISRTLLVCHFFPIHSHLSYRAIDVVTLRQGIKLARTIGSTAPFKDALGAEVTPGPDVQTDADIENWLRNTAGTEFHPCGACAMLPKAQGGVVDANLKVYGLCKSILFIGRYLECMSIYHLQRT